ncbi:MAG TPA: metallopeptidase TldD-related protein [Blastocatellia bacterium]|nr:metallopeptidase TldD-related protein [Blastocatellia bacterium]
MNKELLEEFATGVVRQALQSGASAAEAVVRQRTEFSVGVRLGEVETLEESADEGFGLRVLIDGRQASVSGSDLSPEAIASLVKQAIMLARATSPDDSAGLPDPDLLARVVPDLELYDLAVETLPTEEKIQLALRAEAAAREVSPKITNSDGGGFDTSTGVAVLANSLGFVGSYSGTTCSLTTVPVASDGEKMQRAYWYDVRRKLSELESPEEIGRVAAERALRKLGARPVETQSVPVVFEPTLARELLGDIFQAVSGESVFRKASFLVGQLGERVAVDSLTVVDDGQMPGKLGSRPFDSEGLPTRRTVVIRNGILENYLLNTYTGRKLGLKSTGNASRALVGAPGVGAGNMFIEPGTKSPEEIIKSLSKGFLVTELLGFGVNIVTGDYSRSASGIWIESGELTFPVQGVTVAGNLKEMLNSIETIGNDLDFRGSLASPTLLIGSMTVSA